jgi:hypothetical protein
MKNLIITMILWAVCAAAQEPAKPKTPVIPAEDQAEYYRADGALARAVQAQREAQADITAAVEKLRQDCGADYLPSDAGKKLACVAKPKEEKK